MEISQHEEKIVVYYDSLEELNINKQKMIDFGFEVAAEYIGVLTFKVYYIKRIV